MPDDYPGPTPLGAGHKPPVINTQTPEPAMLTARQDLVRAKIGLLQLDALEICLKFTSAQIANSPGLQREHLVAAAGSMERLVHRLKELLR